MATEARRTMTIDAGTRPQFDARLIAPAKSGDEEAFEIGRAMGQLPKGSLAILVLHDVEGYLHTEIAQLQDCSIGNSKSQLSRARWNMRELLRSSRKEPWRSETTPKKVTS